MASGSTTTPEMATDSSQQPITDWTNFRITALPHEILLKIFWHSRELSLNHTNRLFRELLPPFNETAISLSILGFCMGDAAQAVIPDRASQFAKDFPLGPMTDELLSRYALPAGDLVPPLSTQVRHNLQTDIMLSGWCSVQHFHRLLLKLHNIFSSHLKSSIRNTCYDFSEDHMERFERCQRDILKSLARSKAETGYISTFNMDKISQPDPERYPRLQLYLKVAGYDMVCLGQLSYRMYSLQSPGWGFFSEVAIPASFPPHKVPTKHQIVICGYVLSAMATYIDWGVENPAAMIGYLERSIRWSIASGLLEAQEYASKLLGLRLRAIRMEGKNHERVTNAYAASLIEPHASTNAPESPPARRLSKADLMLDDSLYEAAIRSERPSALELLFNHEIARDTTPPVEDYYVARLEEMGLESTYDVLPEEYHTILVKFQESKAYKCAEDIWREYGVEDHGKDGTISVVTDADEEPTPP